MTQLVSSAEAARRLGVQRATLYAYVSRGLLGRKMSADGRSSLYDVVEVDALASRGRRVATGPPPTIDALIVTAVSALDEDGVRYRGRDVVDLARTRTYEDVAELLWVTGRTPPWPVPAVKDLRLAARAKSLGGPAPLAAMVMLASALGARHGDDDPPAAARRLLGLTPELLGDAHSAGRLAERLAQCWQPDVGDALAECIDRALILLADHELATSTLAVRIAASTRTGPYEAFATGLAVLQGSLHGGAAGQVHRLLLECEEHDASHTVGRRLAARQRIPGFGHRIYRGEDPRLRPLLDAVGDLRDPRGRRDIVDALLIEAGIRLPHHANVDLGLGALSFVADLPPDAPLFAVARITGFAAHFMEELDERPLRYRGLARRS